MLRASDRQAANLATKRVGNCRRVQITAGPLHGVVDEVTADGRIRGWAQDLVNPDYPVALEVLHKNQLAGRVLACDYRPGLEAAGIGTGWAEFSLNME